MKNKKLFAILTLVCFMFTLMPVAAFAAPATTAELDVNSVKTTEAVTVTIDNETGAARNYYVFAIDENEKLYTGYTNIAGGVLTNTEVIFVENLSDATTVGVSFKFADAGTYEVLVAQSTGAGMDGIMAGDQFATSEAILDALLAAAEKVDFEGNNIVRVKAVAESYYIDVTGTGVVSGSPDYDYKIDTVGNPAVSVLKADNGFTSPVFKVALTKGDQITPVKYEKVTYSTNSGYLKVVEIDSATDKNGEAEFRLAAAKAGEYKVTVSYGKTVKTILVKVATNGVAGVTTVDAPKAPVALETELNGAFTGVVFGLTDANGSVMNTAVSPADVQVAVVKKPADSKMGVDTKFGLSYVAAAGGYVVVGTQGANDTFDAEGDYTIRVALANGATAMANVTVKEFGEPVAMKLTYKQNTIALESYAEVKALVLVDANGTTKNLETADLATYEIEYVANGLAVDSVADRNAQAPGKIGTITKAEAVGLDLIGSTITVMAISEKLDLTATAELKVVKDAVALKYASATADVAVNNKLVVNTVDVDGNVVAIDTLQDNTPINIYVLDAPENAKYDVKATVKPSSKNTILVDFTASAPGEYKVQTVVKYDTDKYISSIDTITVGAGESDFKDVVVISIGADKMIVNNKTVALDVAPYIENDRTMMQYNVLGAFGFDIQWVQETRSVVAEGNGIKVVMNIDSKVATVNGEEVTLDVAPTIVNGRTVVPVGFLTGTFGINPTFIYGETGLDSILFAK